MLQPLYKVAILAIFLILLKKDLAVSADCDDDLRNCKRDYAALETILDTEDTRLYRNFAQLVTKLNRDKRQWNRIEKFTYELINGCDFIPQKDMEYIFPYVACKWLGYNYNTCINYMTATSRYVENLPALVLPSNCPQALILCNEATSVAKEKIFRIIWLSEHILRILNDGTSAWLVTRANKLEQKVKSKLECPQYNGLGCPQFINCTRRYQLKQQELETVLEQKYVQYARYYEDQGEQLKLKERLAVLIKQNATQFGHCAIRPSSARNMTSPYQGLVYYAYKYKHMPPSACTTGNIQLPPIPGDRDCYPMLIRCDRLIVAANNLIKQEKEDLKCFTDSVNDQTAYTESLKKLIKELELDVQKKINRPPCLSCPDVSRCNKEYLDLQKTLNVINQQIQDEYLEKYEREGKQAIFRDKGGRMQAKINIPCNIVPVTTFKYVYPWNSCFWREYLMGISLEKAIHSFTANLDKLPDLTQVLEVTKSCSVTEAECRRRLADGKILLTSRQIELSNLRRANTVVEDLAAIQTKLTNVEKHYYPVAGLSCLGAGTPTCKQKLTDCNNAYNGSQEWYDYARSTFQKELTDYYELSGYVDKLTTVESSLNSQIAARCETIPEIPKEMLRRPYLAPHEDEILSSISHLSILVTHSSSKTDLGNCTNELINCEKELKKAETLITGAYNLAKLYYDVDKGRCAWVRSTEYGIIKKTMALRDLTEQNKRCYRVIENGRTITYYYDDRTWAL